MGIVFENALLTVLVYRIPEPSPATVNDNQRQWMREAPTSVQAGLSHTVASSIIGSTSRLRKIIDEVGTAARPALTFDGVM